MSRLIFTIFFVVSLITHFYKFPVLVSFDADQEYYAQKYREIILMGKPTLIGIPTSVGGMFVGPLYTYFSVLVYLIFQGNPLGIYIVTLLISSLNSPLTFLLFSKIKNQSVGIIGGVFTLFSFTLWTKAFAPSIIQLLYPMGLFFFYFVVVSIRKKRYSYFLILLFALTFQIHFSLFLFFPIFLIITIWQRNKIKIDKRFLVLSLIAIVISVLPLILFDFRHDNLLTKNISGFFQSNGSENYLNFKRLRKFSISFWNFSSHLLVPETNVFTDIFLILISFIFLINLRKNKNLFTASIFLAVTYLLLLFYKGLVPDYYFLFIAPVIFYIVSRSITLNWLTVSVLVFLVFQNIKMQTKVLNPYNYFIKLKAVEYLKNKFQDKPVRVLLDTDLGLQFGFEYLMDYLGVIRTSDPQAVTYQISLRQDESRGEAEFREKNAGVGIKVKFIPSPTLSLPAHR